MMRFVLGCGLAIGGGILVVANDGSAQVLNSNQPNNNMLRPAISPYLNMNRSGNPAINYYGLVKPQVDTAKQLQTLQQQVQQNQLMPQLGAAPEDDGMLSNYAITGHPASFSSYSHYFGQTGSFSRPVPPPQGVIKR